MNLWWEQLESCCWSRANGCGPDQLAVYRVAIYQFNPLRRLGGAFSCFLIALLHHLFRCAKLNQQKVKGSRLPFGDL